MLNHRFITEFLDAAGFVGGAVEFLRRHAGGKRVFCALSGGIDSALTCLLLERAGIDTVPVFIDHGLMRLIRGREEREHVAELFPAVVVEDISDDFLPEIFGVEDAEAKRRTFKRGYSQVIGEVIGREGCDLLADGTILPDIEESFGVKISDIRETMDRAEEAELLERNRERFVKSQHNLDIEYDVEATVQPVASLTKNRVREVLAHLGMPPSLVYRKAFPGPALATRIIGPVTRDLLDFERVVHDVVETAVDDHYVREHGMPMIVNSAGEQEPFQAFAASGENVLSRKVTGIVGGRRTYGPPEVATGPRDFESLVERASRLEGATRLFFEVATRQGGRYDVVVRSVNSKDARTASVTELPWTLIDEIAGRVMAMPGAGALYLDVTPKPPGTIEYV